MKLWDGTEERGSGRSELKENGGEEALKGRRPCEVFPVTGNKKRTFRNEVIRAKEFSKKYAFRRRGLTDAEALIKKFCSI